MAVGISNPPTRHLEYMPLLRSMPAYQHVPSRLYRDCFAAVHHASSSPAGAYARFSEAVLSAQSCWVTLRST